MALVEFLAPSGALVVACRLCGKDFSNKRILFFCDNESDLSYTQVQLLLKGAAH